jgi:hypothetical protein
MKLFITAALVLLCCACTTLRPTEASPEELQHRITHENLIEPGDRLRLATADGAVHKFRVTKIENGMVIGPNDSVPIQDIVAVETREFSIGKTAALAGGMAGAYLILLILAAPAFVLAGS